MYLFLLNKLEFPSPKDAFGKFEWNRPIGSGDEEFLDFAICFCYYLPSEKGVFLSETWIPFTQRCFVPGLVEINNWLRKK